MDGNYSDVEDDMMVTLKELNDKEAGRFLPSVLFTAFICVPGIIGNTITLVVFCRSNSQPATKRIAIIAMATYDCLSTFILLPLNIADVYYPYMFPAVWACKLMRFLFYFAPVASTSTLLLVAVERFRKACRPLCWQITPRMAKRCIFGAVLFSILVALPGAVMNGESIVKTGVANITGTACEFDDNFKKTIYPTIYHVFLLAVAIGCSIFLLVCYGVIWKHIRRHVLFTKTKTAISAVDSSNSSWKGKENGFDIKIRIQQFDSISKSFSSEQEDFKLHGGKGRSTSKITKVMFVVSSVFILSFMPHCTLMIIMSVYPGFFHTLDDVQFDVLQILLRSFMIHYVANPIIYGAMDTSFRQDCKKMFLSCKPGWK